MARGRKASDPFDILPDDFKDAVTNMDTSEIRVRISEVALNQVELMKAKAEDGDLKEKQEELKYATEVYREGSKMNKRKIEFCKRVLEDKGVDTSKVTMTKSSMAKAAAQLATAAKSGS